MSTKLLDKPLFSVCLLSLDRSYAQSGRLQVVEALDGVRIEIRILQNADSLCAALKS